MAVSQRGRTRQRRRVLQVSAEKPAAHVLRADATSLRNVLVIVIIVVGVLVLFVAPALLFVLFQFVVIVVLFGRLHHLVAVIGHVVAGTAFEERGEFFTGQRLYHGAFVSHGG